MTDPGSLATSTDNGGNAAAATTDAAASPTDDGSAASVTDNSGTWSVIEIITHNTAAPTMIAVRRARSGAGANWRLNQAREANGKKAGSGVTMAIDLISLV